MKKHLLIVDDEELILENLSVLLEDLVDKTFLASDGKEGLEVLKSEEITCIISDINMPKMDGLKFIKSAREAGFDTPFIFFTAHGNQELMMEAVKYGAFDFLDKPNFDGLEEVVSNGIKQGFKIQNNDSNLNHDEVVETYRELLNKKPK